MNCPLQLRRLARERAGRVLLQSRFVIVWMVTALTLVPPVPTSAQDAFAPYWSIGAASAMMDNRHTRGVEIQPDCDCREFGRGDGVRAQYGIAARYQASWHVAVDARLTVDNRSAEFESVLFEELRLLPNTQQVVTMSATAYSDVDYRMITLDALASARVPLSDGFSISASAGPTIGVGTTSTYSRWQVWDDGRAYFTHPENGADHNRITYNTDSDLEDASPLRISAKVGASLEAEFDIVTLRLGAYYDYGFTSTTSDAEWSVNSGVYQFDVLLAL